MDIREFSKNNILILDGAMGTMLQNGCEAEDVHRAYLDAGASVILTNTFEDNSDENIRAAVASAKKAAEGRCAYVALDIAPTGRLLEPMGTLKFDEAYEMFARQVRLGAKNGIDAIYIETMTDLYEAKCAVLAAKENCDLPIFCTMSFEKGMRTFVGVDIASMALTLTGLGVDFIGINCSVGPKEMRKMAAELVKWTHLPIIIKPNAGLPSYDNAKTVFNVSPEDFAAEMTKILDLGVSGIGGCCGTTPEFILRLADVAKNRKPNTRQPVNISAVCSAAKTVVIDRVRIIGERINPTGKKRFQQALLEKDTDYIVSQAIEQVCAGADILDVNVGLPGIDESTVMVSVIKNIQSVTSVPLQIDSSAPEVIEAGLRAYCGKAIVNSVSGEDESITAILPIVKKYGAAVIGLTLDKNGIPKTAEQRFIIAEKIVNAALSYGIPKQDIFIDCLTLTSGAEQPIAYETLNAVRLVKERLGVKTVLGVSNISFGLPARDKLNQIFLTLAMANGLDLPIINPNNADMIDAIYCYHQLKNIDKASTEYINRFSALPVAEPALKNGCTIEYCIAGGLKDDIKLVVSNLLAEHAPLDIINRFLIPALDDVGKQYEKGAIFLPQLLASAEAAKAAFEIVKEKMPVSTADSKQKILLATVRGDIHDIGKNIVKVVLENYGYDVIDLGKDVQVEEVVRRARLDNVKLVGLSALMTTTLENMEKTIAAIKHEDMSIAVMVGGAVLSEEYARKMGADFYSKDAIEAVEIAKKVFSS